MKQSRTRKVLRKAFSVFLFFIVTAHQCYSNPTINNLQSQISQTRAVIKQPVVDMSLNSARLEYICASPEVKKCPRAHQGLYNELVDCIEEDGEFVKIACPNIIYGFNPITQKPLNTLWVDKKYLVPLQHLSSNYLATIPHPRYAHEPTIVLVYPWRHYSVGTRFKHLRALDTADAYAITCVDFQEDNVLIDYVPKQTAIQEIMRDTQTCRKLFVAIANALVDRVHVDSNGCVIPYVWGGSSFVTPSVDADFYLEDGLWQRQGCQNPYTGYDCSEFVMRMAQIAGLEFPWKTSAVMKQVLRELGKDDMLEEGDLIWTPGHVMIVSNIKNNEIIESRGYASGYGRVHRLTLKEFFDGIATYNDLLRVYRANEPIKIKNKQGKAADKSVNFTLLKLT